MPSHNSPENIMLQAQLSQQNTHTHTQNRSYRKWHLLLIYNHNLVLDSNNTDGCSPQLSVRLNPIDGPFQSY